MTSPADRPVTLVEAEAWLAQVEAYYRGGNPWPMTRSEVRRALVRLTRAEQALADNERIIQRLFDVITGWEANATLRASQGGQT